MSSGCDYTCGPDQASGSCFADGFAAAAEIDAAFAGGLRYYIIPNILWNADALFEGTQT
jgi:hypothetical protein